MDIWTKVKYKEFCKGHHSDTASDNSEDDEVNEMVWFEMAEGLLETTPGLRAFIKSTFGATDERGRLADDLSCG